MAEYNDMQLLKREMFAMRNGVVADVLRRGGSPFKIIFGVNLPQLTDMATRMPHTRAFAEQVWANATTRESMLIAPMLMPQAEFSPDDARRWVSQVPHTEVADVLCLKLLRHLPDAWALAQELLRSERDMDRYTALRLMCNLSAGREQQLLDAAACEGEKNCQLTLPIVRFIALNYQI